MPSRDTIAKLLKRQLDNEPLSEAEKVVLLKWSSKSEVNQTILKKWSAPAEIRKTICSETGFDQEKSWLAIESQLTPKPQYRVNITNIGLFAASFLFILFVLVFYRFQQRFDNKHDMLYQRSVAEIPSFQSTPLHMGAFSCFDFQQMSLPRAVEELGRWYNVEFVIDPSLQKLELSAQFFRSRNLSEILAILELGGQFHTLQHGRTYYLIANGRKTFS